MANSVTTGIPEGVMVAQTATSTGDTSAKDCRARHQNVINCQCVEMEYVSGRKERDATMETSSMGMVARQCALLSQGISVQTSQQKKTFAVQPSLFAEMGSLRLASDATMGT